MDSKEFIKKFEECSKFTEEELEHVCACFYFVNDGEKFVICVDDRFFCIDGNSQPFEIFITDHYSETKVKTFLSFKSKDEDVFKIKTHSEKTKRSLMRKDLENEFITQYDSGFTDFELEEFFDFASHNLLKRESYTCNRKSEEVIFTIGDRKFSIEKDDYNIDVTEI